MGQGGQAADGERTLLSTTTRVLWPNVLTIKLVKLENLV